MQRRDCLKRIASAVVLGSYPAILKADEVVKLSKEELHKARRQAAHRRRRITMNNDGNEFSRSPDDVDVTPKSFLAQRTTPLLGSQVDAIRYCSGVFDLYTHRSEESELRADPNLGSRHVHKLLRHDTDSLEQIALFGRKHDIEVFWSMRMNDTHDSHHPRKLARWKTENPHLLMGKKGDRPPFGGCAWASVDYTHEAVRQKVFRILQDVATRYDIAGIELDFFRHLGFFKAQAYGEPLTQEHCDMMTDLLRQVRQMTEDVSAKRGKPMLISARLPDSLGYCKALGLDLKRWLEDDLLDIIVGGGYFKLEPWANLVTLGKRYDVPVYACLVSRRIMGGGKPEAKTSVKRWRGEALAAWRVGVDGIYTFNRFDPNDRVFREIGDPKLLAKLKRIDQESYAGHGMLDPGGWVKGGRKYLLKNPY